MFPSLLASSLSRVYLSQKVGPRTDWRGLALCLALLCPGLVQAQGVTAVLEDGRLYEGGVDLVPSVLPTPAQKEDAKRILLIDDQLRRTFVDKKLLRNLEPPLAGDQRERIIVKQGRVAKKGSPLASLGLIVKATPFDAFGRRTVTLAGSGQQLTLDQGITEITPTVLRVQALSKEGRDYEWDMRLDTATLEPELLRKLVAQQGGTALDQGLKLTRLYLQSNRFRDALRELNDVLANHPDQVAQLSPQKKELGQLLSKQILDEIEVRRNAGQHALVLSLLEEFPSEEATGEVLGLVRQRLTEHRERQARLDKFMSSIAGQAESLSDEVVRSMLTPLIAEMKAELSHNTLDRTAAYLRLADDESQPLENRLALAVSGWLLGPNDTLTDVQVAISASRVRAALIEYLREQSPEARRLLLDGIRSEAAATPELVAKILQMMKPPLERPEEDPKIAGYYTCSAQLPSGEPVPYYLQLPPEYDPHVHYPTIVTLNGTLTTAPEQVEWWAGKPNDQGARQGQAGRHGYIVLAVEWRDPSQSKYRYTETEHARVLFALRDAARRFSLDSDRIYLSGHSAGGDAAWDLALSHPDLWAGVIPIVATADLTIPFYRINAGLLPFYYVGGELDSGKLATHNLKEFDHYLKHLGYDATVVLYQGRGHESFAEERQRLFDWMSRKVRKFRKDKFEVRAMRESDRFFWWLEVNEFPQAVIADPLEWPKRPKAMTIKGSVTNVNSLSASAGGQDITVWVSPEWLDFTKPMEVTVNGKDFRISDKDARIDDIMEDVRTRADRQHPFWIKLQVASKPR